MPISTRSVNQRHNSTQARNTSKHVEITVANRRHNVRSTDNRGDELAAFISNSTFLRSYQTLPFAFLINKIIDAWDRTKRDLGIRGWGFIYLVYLSNCLVCVEVNVFDSRSRDLGFDTRVET